MEGSWRRWEAVPLGITLPPTSHEPGCAEVTGHRQDPGSLGFLGTPPCQAAERL